MVVILQVANHAERFTTQQTRKAVSQIDRAGARQRASGRDGTEIAIPSIRSALARS